jgi:DNA-binding MarR family transcriptional regulator
MEVLQMENYEVIKSNLNIGSFIQVSNYVLFDKNLTSAQYHMFCVLSSFCYGSKESCFPSLDTLSKLIGKDPRTVNRIINELIMKGYVIKKERPGSSNIYILTHPGYITKKIAQKLQDDHDVSGGLVS